MGSVWRAEHIELGTPAAVKLIAREIADNDEALSRFKREAQAAATLRSPHVVQILDYGVDEGTPYIAMELLEGESLDDRLARLGTLSPEMTAGILTHVARAVGKAHEIGVVHRDLKPDNVFIIHNEDEEIAKVLDFGIAKETTDGLGPTAGMQTKTGAMLGTPSYMSPEQASGKRQVDHRTDIWAMAVIAYECLTGRLPFEADLLGGLILSICTETPAPPSQIAGVPAGFDEWFARGTAKDPDGRFDSAREAAKQLRALCMPELPRSALDSIPDLQEPGAGVAAQMVPSSMRSPSAWPIPLVPSRREPAGAKPIGTQMSAASATLHAQPERSRLNWVILGAAAIIAVGAVASALVVVREGDAGTAASSESPPRAASAVMEELPPLPIVEPAPPPPAASSAAAEASIDQTSDQKAPKAKKLEGAARPAAKPRGGPTATAPAPPPATPAVPKESPPPQAPSPPSADERLEKELGI